MFKAYQEYNEYENEWFKSIPIQWKKTRLQNVLCERNEKNTPIKETNILSLSMHQGIVPISEKQGAGGNKPKENLEEYKISCPNDIVMNSMNVVVGSVGLNKYTGLISPAYYALYNRKKENNIYYWNYIFQSEIFQKSLFSLGKGILFKESSNGKLNTIRIKISMDSLNRVYLPFPSTEEQTQIATFLNQETQKIDHLISKQEKLIELLEEQRKSIISYTVTKGINPNAEMKESGVEWLGDVPKEWNVTRFSSIFEENKRKNKGMIENNLLSLSYGRIIEKDINNAKGLVPENFDTYQIIYPNDIIFRFTDLQNDKRSLRSAYSTFKGIITSAYISVSSQKEINIEFYHYLFRTYDLMKVFYSMGDGMRQSLKIDELNKMLILIPSIEEQNKIVEFINNENTKINHLIQKQTSLIEKLKEYRASIISHAVTGKIDVRG